MKTRRANLKDFDSIIKLIDNDFTKEGFGFVNREQIKTEILKRRVVIAENGGGLLGVRIGLGTVWNMVIAHEARGQGIGKALIDYMRPHTIRVKADPIGHLSKEQKETFVDPTGFYEALGFRLWGLSYPRNFWQKGKDGKGQFHIKGKTAHIKVYKDPNAVMFLSAVPIGRNEQANPTNKEQDCANAHQP